MLLAFLLANDLLKYPLCSYPDGQRSLQDHLLSFFAWHPAVSLSMDWYHVSLKCYQLCSTALAKAGKKETLAALRHQLWYGQVDAALGLLAALPPAQVRNAADLEKLTGYLERSCPHLAHYAVRKELGLPNSSNPSEKTNDLLVAQRQKHHGMAWSVAGSHALAARTMVRANQETTTWLQTGTLTFRLVPGPRPAAA